MTQKKQKETNWRPNSKQVAIAEMLLNPEDRRTKTDKMKAASVSRKAFYSWMKDPRFINYLNNQLGNYTSAELADVWRSLINAAKRGNIQAIKLYFEMKNLYAKKKEFTGAGGGAIGVKQKNEQSYATIETIIAEHPELVDVIFGTNVGNGDGDKLIKDLRESIAEVRKSFGFKPNPGG